MKERILIIILIVLMLSAGVAMAYPAGPDVEAYPAPVSATATIDPYPMAWPTVAAVPTATQTPEPIPTSKPDKPRVRATEMLPDGLPYIND